VGGDAGGGIVYPRGKLESAVAKSNSNDTTLVKEENFRGGCKIKTRVAATGEGEGG